MFRWVERIGYGADVAELVETRLAMSGRMARLRLPLATYPIRPTSMQQCKACGSYGVASEHSIFAALHSKHKTTI